MGESRELWKANPRIVNDKEKTLRAAVEEPNTKEMKENVGWRIRRYGDIG